MTKRVTAAAAVSTVLGTLPVFLLGGLAVLVRADLAFSEVQLGAAATVFFAASAVCSYAAGRAAERYGAYLTTAIAAIGSATALLGIAVLARSYAVLLAFLVVGGFGNACAQLGSNAALARGVPRDRQGFAYGVKQSAIPISTLLAGVAVPAVGLTVGWRWAFAGAAVTAALFLVVVPRTGRPPPRSGAASVRAGDAATLPLVAIAVAAALAAAANNSFGAFLVASAVADGMAVGSAGLLFAAGSAFSIAGRLALGWSADRRDGRHLPVIAALMLCGTAGLVLLAGGGGAGLAAGTLLAFAGWTWPGLLNYAVVRVNRNAPAAATGITQTGVFVGGGAGPLAFGLLVQRFGYQTAWTAAALALAVAACLVLVGRRLLVRDLRGRGTAPSLTR